MAIKVKSSGGGAPIGGAFVGGQARRQIDDAKLRVSALNSELNSRRGAGTAYSQRQGAGERQAASIDARQDAQLSDQAAREEAATTAFDRTTETMGASAKLRERASALEAARRLNVMGKQAGIREDAAAAGQLRKHEDIEFALSAKQRDEYNKLSDAYDDAVASGDYSEEELAEIRDQVTAKRMGIKPQPRIKKQSQWPAGQDVGETWATVDGATLTRDNKGNVKKLKDASGVTPKDRADAWKTAYEALKDPEGLKKTDMDEVAKLAERILGTEEPAQAAPVALAAAVAPRAADESVLAAMKRSGMDVNDPEQVKEAEGILGFESKPESGSAPDGEEKMVTVETSKGKFTMVPESKANELARAGGVVVAEKKQGLTKKIDTASAQAILDEAGGDKDRARALAKERGYTF